MVKKVLDAVLRQAQNDRKEYSPHRYIELGVENKRAIEKINLLNIVGRSLCFSLLNYIISKKLI